MPTVNAARFKRRLEKLKRRLPGRLMRESLQLGNRIKQDIVTTAAYNYSPSWQRAIHRNGPFANQPYFKQQRTTGGLLDTINSLPVIVRRQNMGGSNVGSKGVVTMSFGSEAELDAQVPYWRLFEFGGPGGMRTGGSDTHGFLPGAGVMVAAGTHTREVEDGIFRQFEVEPHPGVLPVHMFSDTFQHYKKIIRRQLKGAIIESVRTI